MKAVILAAGRGSRMKGMTLDRPKCLVQVTGRPLLSWQLSALHQAGVTQTALVVGFAANQLTPFVDVHFLNPNWAHTNMVRSLQCASSWLSQAPCLVSYADIFYEPSAVRALIDSPSDLAVLYDQNWRTQWEARFANPLDDAESFLISESGDILEIGRRATSLEEIKGQYMGLLKFTPASWRGVDAHLARLNSEIVDKLSMTELLNGLIAEGVQVSGVPYTGMWGEVDRPEDLNVHEKRLALTAPEFFRASDGGGRLKGGGRNGV